MLRSGARSGTRLSCSRSERFSRFSSGVLFSSLRLSFFISVRFAPILYETAVVLEISHLFAVAAALENPDAVIGLQLADTLLLPIQTAHLSHLKSGRF